MTVSLHDAAEAPRQRCRDHQHRSCPRRKHSLDKRALVALHGLVHQSDTETQRVTHGGVFDPLEMRRQILGLASKEFVGLSVRGGKGEKVERRKLGMLASGHEHDGRLALGRVLADRTVHGSRHRLHARLEIDDVNALDVDVQRHGSDARREVEHPVAGDAAIHSPMSLAFAREVHRPTTRMGFSNWELMYRMRLVTTSIVGPTAPPIRCSSSAMKSETFCTFLRCFHRRLSTSHWCGVAMITCPFSSSFKICGRFSGESHDAHAALISESRLPINKPLSSNFHGRCHVHTSRSIRLTLCQLV